MLYPVGVVTVVEWVLLKHYATTMDCSNIHIMCVSVCLCGWVGGCVRTCVYVCIHICIKTFNDQSFIDVHILVDICV